MIRWLCLLRAFQTGLSIADQPFLSSLEKDRAPRVRTLAAQFLTRLGAGGKNAALGECLERIKQGRSGLIRKRATLELELPANVKDQTALRWILQTFTEVSFGELADALKMKETELIDAAEKDERLLLAFALMATNERRLDLFELAIANLPNAWEHMFGAGLDTPGTMTESERQRWTEMLLLPHRKELPSTYALWDWLHRITDQEAPPSVMSIVLQSKLLTKAPEPERGSAPWVELIAAMCPASHRRELREQLAEFDQSQTVIPVALLEILEGMENDRSHV